MSDQIPQSTILASKIVLMLKMSQNLFQYKVNTQDVTLFESDYTVSAHG